MKTYTCSFTYLKFSLRVNGYMYIRTKNVGNYCVEKNQMHLFFIHFFHYCCDFENNYRKVNEMPELLYCICFITSLLTLEAYLEKLIYT